MRNNLPTRRATGATGDQFERLRNSLSYLKCRNGAYSKIWDSDPSPEECAIREAESM